MRLKKNQARLTTDENGLVLLEIPDKDSVPTHAVFLTAIACLIKNQDKRFEKYVWRRWKEIFDEVFGEEDENLR